MAGWDVTVLSAALSMVGGIVWAMAQLALATGKSNRAKSLVSEEITETQAEIGLMPLRSND